MAKIVIDAPVNVAGLKRLQALTDAHPECAAGNDEERRTLPSMLVRDAEIIFCTYPPENFEEMSSLKLIQLASAGYEQLEGLDLLGKGIRACNARGVFDVPIAEWTLAMIVNLSRDFKQMLRNQELGKWDRSACFQVEVRGRTLGIWGYGGIGRETARLAKAMGLKVHVLTRCGVKRRHEIYRVRNTGDPEGKLPDRVFDLNARDEFLSGLDYLTLAMPLNQSNEGIVGFHELQKLPNHAFLLNPARGSLVQEEALLTALREGWISGAALDAHYYYPMPLNHPLWRFPNVIMTPHISGSSAGTHFVKRVWDIFLQNVERYLGERPLLNELPLRPMREQDN